MAAGQRLRRASMSKVKKVRTGRGGAGPVWGRARRLAPALSLPAPSRALPPAAQPVTAREMRSGVSARCSVRPRSRDGGAAAAAGRRPALTAARSSPAPAPSPPQFKIEPFKHPLKLDPNYAGAPWDGWGATAWELPDVRGGECLVRTCFLDLERRHGLGWAGIGAAAALLRRPPAGPPTLALRHLLRRLADNTWQLLESAIHEINNHNASGLSFEELYRWVQGLTRL